MPGRESARRSGINLDSVEGLLTPSNSNLLLDLFDSTGTILGDAQLNIETGNLVGSSSTSWEFAAGGLLSITGSVDLNQDGIIDSGDIVNQVLAQGTMNSSAVINAAGTFYVLGGGTFSYINPELANFFGYNGTEVLPADGAVNLLFTISGGLVGGEPFSSNSVLSGDVAFSVPTNLFTSVPEASTLVLCSIVTMAGGLSVWRSRRAF